MDHEKAETEQEKREREAREKQDRLDFCRGLIETYRDERPAYVKFAEFLEDVFDRVKKPAVPEAEIQARAKTMSSYTKKVFRKAKKYFEEGRGPTDLCGARLIVQTLQQVKAVRAFIEANFEILETEDKQRQLDDDSFGYRDVHYLVKLKAEPDHAGLRAASNPEFAGLTAELQVRTWVQHAWADTMHDRLYKAPLKPSSELRRAGARLAALMEEADLNFDEFAGEVDMRIANYSTFVEPDTVAAEIEIQESILAHEENAEKRPALALELAKLVSRATGDHERVVAVLEPVMKDLTAETPGLLLAEIWLELGYALCKTGRKQGNADGEQFGRRLMEQAQEELEAKEIVVVPRLHEQRGLLARTYSRLGWYWEDVKHGEDKALEYYQKALREEPENPYRLVEVLYFELFCDSRLELPESTCIAVRHAIGTCREHVVTGIEMPQAAFTAGRLQLLLVDPTDETHAAAYEALYWFARGLRHCGKTAPAVVAEALEREQDLIRRRHRGKKEKERPAEFHWALDLLDLARRYLPCLEAHRPAEPLAPASDVPAIEAPVLVISGGAATLADAAGEHLQAGLVEALASFPGTVISGGTTCGVPGRVGAAADTLSDPGPRPFKHLLGYLPNRLPRGDQEDTRYDERIWCQELDFTPEQVLRSWQDLLGRGIAPDAVKLLGYGGGPLSRIEYCIALALNAEVGLVQGTGGAVDNRDGEPPKTFCGLLDDPVWHGDARLLPLPDGFFTWRAFIHLPERSVDEKYIDDMARRLHASYLEHCQGDLPPNMRPWDELDDEYMESNREQARGIIALMQATGFDVVESPAPDTDSAEDPRFVEALLELARREHGRWNVQKLRAHWRPGPSRIEDAKIHNCIVCWEELSKDDRDKDFNSVKLFPALLAEVGLRPVLEDDPDKQ